jgi:uncharacterized protein (DUF885 family)
MKKSAILLFTFVFVLLSTSMVFSLQNKEDEKFQKFLESYFEDLWKFYPTSATMAGFHKFDNKLEDVGKKNIEKRYDALNEANQELVAKIDSTALSPELQIDHAMMVDALDTEMIKFENLLPWEYNPLFYNEILNNCIRSLITKESVPLEERAKNAADRLGNIEKLIKQAKENLKTPAQIYTETAIKQYSGILDFYKTQVSQFIEQAPASSKSKLQSNFAKAVTALEDYQNFLQNELLARSTGNFRLLQAHRRLVRITFQNNIPIDELIARAQADYKNIRREMFLVTIPFYKIMDPVFNIEQPPSNLSEDQLFNATIGHVLDKIKGDHTSKEEFLNTVKTVSGEVKEFLTANQIVDLPEVMPEILATPIEKNRISMTQLLKPGLYETDGTFSCFVAPFVDGLTEEQNTEMLEEYNNFILPFWVARNVYPGPFTPMFYTNTNPSLIRKMYTNKPLMYGWPVLLEEKMIMNKYGNYDLRMRLNQLKYRLKIVTDFILDFNIHEAGMEKEQAIAFMKRIGFQSDTEAERNWNRICLNPAEASYPYVGWQEYLDFEKELKKTKGDSFNQKEFMKEVLSHGAIPLRFLKAKIIQ